MLVKFEIALLIFYYNVFGLVTVDFPESEYDGSPCGEGSTKGICKRIGECPEAIHSLKLYKHHDLERCGFDQFTEIVCCPDSPRDRQPEVRAPVSVGQRKSDNACKEYSNEVGPDPIVQILGGEDAKPGEFPHMASIGYENQQGEGFNWECGGSLISNKFVVTAAHCVIKTDGIPPVRIRLGIIDLTGKDNKKPIDFNVKNITVHHDYQPRSKLNDIALIELDGSTTITKDIYPACLYQKNDDPLGLVITGWGHTTPGGEPSVVLQKALLHPVSVTECSQIYKTRLARDISSTQICAVSDDGTKDTCQGDSGGPLQVQVQNNSSIYSIVGITSYGMGCGGKTPGIYTRVYSYLEWIEGIVWR